MAWLDRTRLKIAHFAEMLQIAVCQWSVNLVISKYQVWWKWQISLTYKTSLYLNYMLRYNLPILS